MKLALGTLLAVVLVVAVAAFVQVTLHAVPQLTRAGGL